MKGGRHGLRRWGLFAPGAGLIPALPLPLLFLVYLPHPGGGSFGLVPPRWWLMTASGALVAASGIGILRTVPGELRRRPGFGPVPALMAGMSAGVLIPALGIGGMSNPAGARPAGRVGCAGAGDYRRVAPVPLRTLAGSLIVLLPSS